VIDFHAGSGFEHEYLTNRAFCASNYCGVFCT